MLLLVSDANIFIDLEDGGILPLAFQLSWQIATPDLLYAEELAEVHSHLPALGLVLGELSETAMANLEQLSLRYAGPSRYDCMALALAIQEGCPLLSGDRALRQAAQREGVEIHGTIWLVEQMLNEKLLTAPEARQAFLFMHQAGSRLPWADAEKMITAIEQLAG